MKKVILLMLLLVSTLTANAQFAQGTKYVSTSLSGIGLSYSDNRYCGLFHGRLLDDARNGELQPYT